MRQRRVYLLVVVLVVAGVLVAVFARREREPEYGGKRLSEWVRQYYQPRKYGGSPNADIDASSALRNIGTNALPHLVRWLNYYEAPPWKSRLFGVVNPWLRRLYASWDLSLEPRQALSIGS